MRKLFFVDSDTGEILMLPLVEYISGGCWRDLPIVVQDTGNNNISEMTKIQNEILAKVDLSN